MTGSRFADERVGDHHRLVLEPGERWWGGAVSDGTRMPFGGEPYTRDLSRTDPANPADANQVAPLLLSSTGRVVWSERPFTVAFADGGLALHGAEVTVCRAGTDLRGAFLGAAGRWFPASGRTPDETLFTGPQLCTWIEQPHVPTQDGVLAQVRDAIAAGVSPSAVLIDDDWATDYGTWAFDRARFPDPARMVADLHALGCRVLLWIVPLVSPDSRTFRDLEARGLLLRDASGGTAIRRWWNGLSAALDLSDPAAVDWLRGVLDGLQRDTGVDGFKFDAGDVAHYRADDASAGGFEPVRFTQAWGRLAEQYACNELRACWKLGGRPIVQRLQDKPPSWGADGLRSLIPESIAQGLIGHAFTCPDMIGGGEIGAVEAETMIDQEFFVRYAQVAALMPVMQFSTSPHRVLDEVHLAAVLTALEIRRSMQPLLHALVRDAAETGEPIVRHMAYHAPGLADVDDQFFLGPDLVVAPMLDRAASSREVRLPAGTWLADDGDRVTGPATIRIAVPLDRLPRFTRV